MLPQIKVHGQITSLSKRLYTISTYSQIVEFSFLLTHRITQINQPYPPIGTMVTPHSWCYKACFPLALLVYSVSRCYLYVDLHTRLSPHLWVSVIKKLLSVLPVQCWMLCLWVSPSPLWWVFLPHQQYEQEVIKTLMHSLTTHPLCPFLLLPFKINLSYTE